MLPKQTHHRVAASDPALRLGRSELGSVGESLSVFRHLRSDLIDLGPPDLSHQKVKPEVFPGLSESSWHFGSLEGS